MILYWGSKGFSVRMPLDPPVTVMLCYPPDAFQVYTAGWPVSSEEAAQFRHQLHTLAPFEQSKRAAHTSTLRVKEKTLQRAGAALVFTWTEVKKMVAAARGGQ